MDQHQRAQTTGIIPRSSRLPMPRASNDKIKTLQNKASRENIQADARLKPQGYTRYGSQRSLLKTPLAEANHNGTRGRFGWPIQGSQELDSSPVRQPLTPVSLAALETTPPGTKAVVNIVNGDENDTRFGSIHKQGATLDLTTKFARRRPRPSLTERTAETLAQVSPSPSSTQVPRPSAVAYESNMGPPGRPVSVTSTSRPGTSHISRSPSPTKQPAQSFASAGALRSHELQPTPFTSSFDSIYTPPRAHIRNAGTGNARPLREPRRSTSAVVPDSSHATSHQKLAPAPTAQTMRLRTLHASRILPSRPTLDHIFQNSSAKTSATSNNELVYKYRSSGVSRPGSSDESALSCSKSSRSKSAWSAAPGGLGKLDRGDVETKVSPNKAAKSSAAFREQIAKAKAEGLKARKDKTMRQQPGTCNVPLSTTSDDVDITQGSIGLIRKRVQGASTTGSLHLAAMRLRDIPDEVMHMYEFDESSNINWSETVDLVKLNIADNEISELRGDAFPDLSASDLQAYETEFNQFGGLQVFDLHNNLLIALPIGIRRLERLHTLNLSNNRLTCSALKVICEITGIRELHLAGNDLKGDLPPCIGNLKHLELLDLRCNALDSLPDEFRRLNFLRSLNISENRIRSINIERFIDSPLTELVASRNDLQGHFFDGVFAPWKTLEHLDVSFNKLDSISNNMTWLLPGVKSISMDGNRITHLPSMASAANLMTLTASENLLTELPKGFGELTKLRNADFSRNQIRVIPEEIAKMETLTVLNIASNPLKDRKYLSVTTAEMKDDLRKRFGIDNSAPNEFSTTSDASQAITLVDTYSIAATAPPASTYLHFARGGVLDLSNQDFSTVNPNQIDLTQLVTSIQLTSASLTHLPIELLTHSSVQSTLQNLNLSHNPLHNTSYLSEALLLPSLTSLCIVSTGLISLTALTTHLTAPNLRELNISCHRLSGALPELRAHFPSLTTLLASDNWFNSLPISSVKGLEVLNLCNNQLNYLPPSIGLLGVHPDVKSKKRQPQSGTTGVVDLTRGKLKTFDVGGNCFRIPNWRVVERGTEAILKDLRRMVPLTELTEGWKEGD